MRLAGRKIWITGSARRIGRAMALGCAHEGADIVLHHLTSRDDAHLTAAEIRALGREVLLLQGDIGQPDDVGRMVTAIEDAWGQLDTLVSSASVFHGKPFHEITEEDFFSTLRTNLYGPFLCAQAAIPLLCKASPGRIVHLTDWAVARPYRGYAHYMASKGGLDTLTRALARELAPGILVNAIAPGPILAPEDLTEQHHATIEEKTLLGRWGNPESIVEALLFLLQSKDVCGATITVDAGRSLG